MTREQKIQKISAVTAIGFSLAVFYHYAAAVYFGWGTPANSFLFVADDAFRDFTSMVDFVKDLDPYRCTAIYYPFGEFLLFLFSLITDSLFCTALFLGIFLFFWLRFTSSHFKQSDAPANARDLFVITCMTYPVLFTLDRANLELYGFLFLCGFIFFYKSADKTASFLALLSLSLAIAIKPFPAIFLILLAVEKRWKDVLSVIFLTILVCFLCLFCFEGGVIGNIRQLFSNQAVFFQKYAMNIEGWGYGTSLFGCLKFFIYCAVEALSMTGIIGATAAYTVFPQLMTSTLKLYTVSCLLALAALVIFIFYREKVYWKKVALLIFFMILFPHLSADYRLLYIFIPLALFVGETARGRNDSLYALLFALLLIPKNYLLMPLTGSQMIGYGVVVNPLLMVGFTVLIIRESFMASYTGEAQ